MSDQGADKPRRWLKFRPFVAGVLAGLLAPLAVAFGPWTSHSTAIDYDTHVRSNGADVSRHGAARVSFRDSKDVVSQRCNGACDDLSLDVAGSEYGYEVEVRDAQGACIACQWPRAHDEGKTMISTLPELGVTQSQPSPSRY